MKKFFSAFLFALAFAAIPANAFTMDIQGGVVNHVSEIKNFNEITFVGRCVRLEADLT